MKLLLQKILFFLSITLSYTALSQECTISGTVSSQGEPIANATVFVNRLNKGVLTDSVGFFLIKKLQPATYKIDFSAIGYIQTSKNISIAAGDSLRLNMELNLVEHHLEEIVITGTMKEMVRTESPVPVEVYTSTYFKKNPTPNIFDALQNVNGVRPQINCNVCNTGDIHINGLEGPYTMVLIDGMPIVSSLSTVYGLSGIPNAIIDRIEIVKGPASSLYGSEAVGGLINVITKKNSSAPALSFEAFGTSYGEYNTDAALKLSAGKKASVLTGINYFNYQKTVDKNHDGFTDMTLQNRVSIFQKWGFIRPQNRLFNVAGRYLYEDRWGGDMNWNKNFRGGNAVYGEQIYTSRYELIGNYQLPTIEKLLLSVSLNRHYQNSVYGSTFFLASQNIAFGQLSWDKTIRNHDMLAGAAIRYTYYLDNTVVSGGNAGNKLGDRPQKTYLPGVFVQDEITLNPRHKFLIGLRYDHNNFHGNIITPRLAYKWQLSDKNILRINMGTGFRVVNLFTEDHAALSGARDVIIKEDLKPEQSNNITLNFIKKINGSRGGFLGIDVSAFYTHFKNKIVADYDTDPQKIFYNNIAGYATGKGLSANFDLSFINGLKLIAGATLMENTLTENGISKAQILTENFSGTWAVSYVIKSIKLGIDYTGNVYSPMRLPLVGRLDPRKEKSPWWSLQNIQLNYTGLKSIELFGGIKNLLNWTPNKGNPFIIARSHDPFDKNVAYHSTGEIKQTFPENPYALSFDPTYVYAPNQGIRIFLGFRYNLSLPKRR